MSTTTTKPERPFDSPVDKLRNEFDRLLEAVWSQGEKAADAFGLRPGGRHWSPAVDVIESADAVQVRFDLPGIDPDALEVVLTGNMLTVKGQRILEESHPEDVVIRRERPAGAFCRSLPLPVSVDPNKVTAEAKHGVVTVTLAKEESVKSRHIRVKVTKKDGHTAG